MAFTVLVVDRPEDRKSICDLLQQEPSIVIKGLRIVEAQDGPEGLEVFKRERPDLVITDLQLPRGDGFELCHGIRELAPGRRVALLAVSSVHKDPAVAKQLADKFGAELVPKPLQPRRLVAKVLELMRRDQGAPPPRPAVDPRDVTGPMLVDEEPDAEPAPPAARHPFVTPSPLNLTRPLRTSLDKHSLAWLLVQSTDAGSTGSLRLVRGKIRRVIYLVQGNPVYVDSNLRNETLGHYLVGKKTLTEEQLAEALKQARAGGHKLGETLVRMGLADEATVREALVGQVRLKLVNAMRWPDGAVSFVPGDEFVNRVPQCSVDAVELALLMLKKTVGSPDLRARWEPHLEQAARLTPLGERLRPRVERTFGKSMLKELLTGLALRRALASLLDPAAVLVLLETLRLTGMVELAPALPAAISLEAAPDAAPSTAESEFRDLDPTLPRNRSGVFERAELELCDPAERPPHALPLDRGEVGVPALEELDLEEPGGSSPGLPAVGSTPPAPAPPLPADGGAGRLREALLAAYEGIHDKNFYQVLELEPDAAPVRIEEAYRRALTRFAPAQFQAPELAGEAAKVTELAAIAEQAFSVLSDPLRRCSYDETLALAQVQPQPDADAFGAELLFQEGRARLRDRDFAAAVEGLEAAVRGNPGQPDYHATLGWALFLARGRGEGGALAARPHLEEALRIAPDSAQAHELLGHVELDVQAHAQAAEHFSRALRSGAARLDLFERLRDLLLRLGRFDELEQEYRQIIFRLRDTDPLGTVPLWLELASLYAHRLGQPDNARVALQVAAKMAPGDSRVTQAQAALEAAQGGDWRRQAQQQAGRYLSAPDDASPLRELARLHLAGGRPELARDALAILSARGSAGPEDEQLLGRLSASGLRRASRPLAAAELSLLGADEPGAVLLEALAALAPVLGHLAPLSLESQGGSKTGRLDEATLPQPFRELLAYVCTELGVSSPALHGSDTLGARALPLAGEGLVVGRTVLEGQVQTATVAALAMALSCLDAGRALLLTRSTEDLKDVVMAGLALFNPKMKLDAAHRAAAWHRALQNASAWHEVLRPPMQRLMAARRVNLSEARRATGRFAARTALLLGTDPGAALRLLQNEAELAAELVDFALGEDYERLRRRLELLA